MLAQAERSIALLTTRNETIRSTDKTEQSSHWAIVYLGIGASNKEEYHILNRATGTYLSTTCKLLYHAEHNSSDSRAESNTNIQRPPKTKTTLLAP